MKTDRKHQIIKKAGKLFSKSGYHKITMRDIADSCGITEAALYKHYDSKDAIYTTVLGSIQTRISTGSLFDSLRDKQDIEVILFDLAKFISTLYDKHQDILRLLLYSSLEGHSMAREIYNSLRLPFIKFLAAKIEELIKIGKVVKVNPQLTARCFVGMAFDCALNFKLWKGMSGKVFSHELTMKNNVAIFVRGLKKT